MNYDELARAIDRLADDPVAGKIGARLPVASDIHHVADLDRQIVGGLHWWRGVSGFVDRTGVGLRANLEDGRLFGDHGLGGGKTPGENKENESRECDGAHETLQGSGTLS